MGWHYLGIRMFCQKSSRWGPISFDKIRESGLYVKKYSYAWQKMEIWEFCQNIKNPLPDKGADSHMFYSATAAFSASTLLVFSHGTSMSSRPMWP